MSQLEPLRAVMEEEVKKEEVKEEVKVEDEIDIDEMLSEIEEKLQCPLTHDLMSDPVRVKGEDERQVFERAALEEWIRQNGGNYIGPVTRKLIRDPILVEATDIRKETEIYKKWKQQLMDMVDEKERREAVQNPPQMSFEEMEHKIDLLDELGAYEIAEALRQRMLWLKDYLFSPEGIETIVSGAVGTAAAGCALAAGTEPIGAAVCGATAAAATKSGISRLREKFERDRKALREATEHYYNQMNVVDREPQRLGNDEDAGCVVL